MQRQDFEKAIKGAIVRHAAATRPERESIYAAARSGFRRRPGHTQEELAELEAAVATIEATFATGERASSTAGRFARLRTAALALLAGAALGAGVATYLQAPGGGPAAGGGDAEAMEKIRQAYRDNAGLLPEATKFIRQVVDAVVERQKTDKASLQASTKGLIPLAKFDPELAKRMPKSLPPGTAIVLRADAANLKVLMNWTLCGVASIASPELVDRKRAPLPSVGCPFFGLWTDGAADW